MSRKTLSGELALLQADPNMLVVDVRNTDDYRVGRIPGAVNVYWDSILDTARMLLDADALRAKYAEAGVTLLGFDRIDFFTGKFEGRAV